MNEIVSRYSGLAGKVAVVTGGSGAIGGATCRALARQWFAAVLDLLDRG